MKKIKVLLVIISMLLLSLVFYGCPSKAKKPPTPAPKPGKVTLETIDPTNAPTVVKDLLEKQKDKESFNVIRNGNTLYAVITRGKVVFKNMGVKFKDIEKLDIGNGKNQVRIQVVFTVPDVFPGRNAEGKNRMNRRKARVLTPQERATLKEKLGSKGEFFPVAVAKISINSIPDAVSFSVLHEPEVPAEMTDNNAGTTPSVTQPPQTSITPNQQTGATISVTTPPANATVTTPLTVSGKAKATTVTIELKDDKGNVLATKTVGVTTVTAGQMGDFNTMLTYTPLSQPVKGSLDVFSRGTSGTKEGLVTVPLTIK